MEKNANAKGVHTLYEIESQADSWEGVFWRIEEKEEQLRKLTSEAHEIVLTGCGSAFNISHAVAPFFQKLTGISCRAVHASDLMFYPESFINKKRRNLLLAYSRSGDTTESVMAVDTAKQIGVNTICVVCSIQSQMANKADVSLILEEAVEKSITTTRSLTSMVLAGNYLAALHTDSKSFCADMKQLPALARKKMHLFHEMGKRIGSEKQIQKYAFLGSGSYYGLAREAQLKVKEMVLLPSDAYVSLDFQHGPMSNVDKHTLITIMVSDAGSSYDLDLARNMKSLGGRILILCDRDSEGFKDYADYIIELNTGFGDGIRNILYMPVLQFIAYYRALSEGNDPDNPKNLSYYIDLNK